MSLFRHIYSSHREQDVARRKSNIVPTASKVEAEEEEGTGRACFELSR